MIALAPLFVTGGLLAGLVGLLLTVRRIEQGFWLLSAVSLLLGAWQVIAEGRTGGWLTLTFMAIVAFVGCTIETVSERLRWTRGYVSQQDVMAALVGGMIALFLLSGPMAMILGTVAGIAVVRIRQARGAVRAFFRETFRTAYAMLGAAALRVLLGVILLESLLRLVARI